MAKKPAFLFYSNDYFEGTRTMLPEERACYVDLMVYQHQHEFIPNDIRKIAMYCTGVSEATLIATLEAKFKLCEEGWYNEKLQQVMNDYEEYQGKQSDNGIYGVFIKRLNKDKSIKNLTEIKEFIENIYTRQRLIEDLKKDNDYKATLEALLKQRLSMRVEIESESNLTNSSNNTISEISKKNNLQFTFSNCIEELRKSDNFKIECERILKINRNKFDEYLNNFEFHNKPTDELELFEFDKVRTHFSYWLKNNRDKLPQEQTKPKINYL